MNDPDRKSMLKKLANKAANEVIDELTQEAVEINQKQQAVVTKKAARLSKIDDEERETYIEDREEAVGKIFERMGEIAKNMCKGCGGKGHYLQTAAGMTEGEVIICHCIMKNPKGRELLRELHAIVQPSKEGEEEDDNESNNTADY